MPLRSFLGPLETLLEGLESEEMQAVLHENHFLEIALCRFLKLLIGHLGSPSHLLGPIWSQSGSQNGPKSTSKRVSKLAKKAVPTSSQNKQILDLKIVESCRCFLNVESSRSFLKNSFSQDGLRWMISPGGCDAKPI